jgi:hypothetical protein
MFDKFSRYRDVPDVAVPDARGRIVSAKDSRPLPTVTGTFRHTVTSSDRLDQLANQYYGQSLRYWRICDANPDLLSPFALLDQEPVVVARFPLSTSRTEPPWVALVRQLSQVPGVEDVLVVHETAAPTQRTDDRSGVTFNAEQSMLAVEIRYNRLTVDPGTLASEIATQGFEVGPPVDAGQLGKQIVIPVPVDR